MEKEIESAIYFELHLAQTDEPNWEEQASKDIAQAVAEWMRKGVVWEGPGRIGEDGTVILISPVSGETYGAFSPWPTGRLEETPIGQRVRVTVRVEGRSG